MNSVRLVIVDGAMERTAVVSSYGAGLGWMVLHVGARGLQFGVDHVVVMRNNRFETHAHVLGGSLFGSIPVNRDLDWTWLG
jgi:hypothetical protein